MIHTNCQSGMNKRSEINNLVDSMKPHVLALTEFGASATVMDSELGIEGYSLYKGNHSDGNGGLGRGATLYISNALNHSARPLFDDVEFDCSAWSCVKMSNNKSLLVGVAYRSPNSRGYEDSIGGKLQPSRHMWRLQPPSDRLDFSTES